MITCLATYSPEVINCIIPLPKPNSVYCTNLKISSDKILTHTTNVTNIQCFLNWPAPPTIHRGLEWPQFLKSLFVCLFSVCLSANFLIFYSTVQYSIVQYSTVQYSTVRNLFFKCSGHTVQYGTL